MHPDLSIVVGNYQVLKANIGQSVTWLDNYEEELLKIAQHVETWFSIAFLRITIRSKVDNIHHSALKLS